MRLREPRLSLLDHHSSVLSLRSFSQPGALLQLPVADTRPTQGPLSLLGTESVVEERDINTMSPKEPVM